MKHNFFLPLALFIFFLVFLFTTINSHTSAGSGAQVMKMNKKEFESVAKMENPDSLEEVMGVEYCEKGDEECLNRRMAAEAHLDYIYTQHRRP